MTVISGICGASSCTFPTVPATFSADSAAARRSPSLTVCWQASNAPLFFCDALSPAFVGRRGATAEDIYDRPQGPRWHLNRNTYATLPSNMPWPTEMTVEIKYSVSEYGAILDDTLTSATYGQYTLFSAHPADGGAGSLVVQGRGSDNLMVTCNGVTSSVQYKVPQWRPGSRQWNVLVVTCTADGAAHVRLNAHIVIHGSLYGTPVPSQPPKSRRYRGTSISAALRAYSARTTTSASSQTP